MLRKSLRCVEDKNLHNGEFYGENKRKIVLNVEINLHCVDCVSNLLKKYSKITLKSIFYFSHCHRDERMISCFNLYQHEKQVFIYKKLASVLSILTSSESSITNPKTSCKISKVLKVCKSFKSEIETVTVTVYYTYVYHVYYTYVRFLSSLGSLPRVRLRVTGETECESIYINIKAHLNPFLLNTFHVMTYLRERSALISRFEQRDERRYERDQQIERDESQGERQKTRDDRQDESGQRIERDERRDEIRDERDEIRETKELPTSEIHKDHNDSMFGTKSSSSPRTSTRVHSLKSFQSFQ